MDAVNDPDLARRARPSLHVCVTCREGRPLPADGIPPGRHLYDAVAQALAAMPDPPVQLREATCLASCDRGCTAAMMAPGKWGYLLGHLRQGMAADLLAYGAAYAAASSGAVMPSRRPASLQSVVLGRLPAPIQESTP